MAVPVFTELLSHVTSSLQKITERADFFYKQAHINQTNMYTYFFPTGPQAKLITVLSTLDTIFYGYKNLKGFFLNQGN